MYGYWYKTGILRYKATLALLTINTIFYIVESILSGNPFYISDNVLAILGQYNILVLRYKWWWQLITSMFVHLNIGHFLINMFFLYILCIDYERLFGQGSLILTYLICGLSGNLLTLLFYPPYTISGGASGALFGIFAALIVFGGIIGGNIKMMLAYGVLIFVLNMGFGINVFAHFGGFVIGALIGYYYARRAKGYYTVRTYYY